MVMFGRQQSGHPARKHQFTKLISVVLATFKKRGIKNILKEPSAEVHFKCLLVLLTYTMRHNIHNNNFQELKS